MVLDGHRQMCFFEGWYGGALLLLVYGGLLGAQDMRALIWQLVSLKGGRRLVCG